MHPATHGKVCAHDRVEPVCLTVGDWAGFDVRTFDAKTGEEIHVEVKTTTGPARTPFFMSAPEVEYAKSCKCAYKIYRVYEYRSIIHFTQTKKEHKIALP